MKSQSLTLLMFAGPAILLASCGTPYHKQVRQESSDRYELVNAQIDFDQAKQAFATGQFDKAMKAINTAIARRDDIADYHILKGRVSLETNRLEAAVESFDRATELDESLPEPYYFRGIVFQRWSDYPRAAEEYQAAYERADDNVQYLLATAECLIAQQKYVEARDIVEPRMAFFEHNAAMRQLLGHIAMLMNEPRTAIKHFSDAQLLNPDEPLILEDLARAQFEARQFAQAHYTLQQLDHLLDEPRADLKLLEARCLAMTDRPKESRELYLELTRLSPADVNVWIELGNVSYEVGDDRRVASSAQRVIALEPKRYEGYLLKGLYEQRQGRDEEALRQFKKAVELAPDVAWPHILLGMTLEANGQYDAAVSAYGMALKIDPNNEEARRLFEGAGTSVSTASENQ